MDVGGHVGFLAAIMNLRQNLRQFLSGLDPSILLITLAYSEVYLQLTPSVFSVEEKATKWPGLSLHVSYECICVFECIAVLARRKLSRGPQAIKTARDLGKASYVTSIAGIIVAAFIVVIILTIVVSRQFADLSTIECPEHNFIWRS